MTTPASRLITLIMLLQRHPNQKAADLAQELGVSIRSLHRYLAELEEMGIPIYSERGPYGGYSLVRGYKMPPLVFTPEEATAVALGTSLVEQMWGELYREAARAALAKLHNVLPDGQRAQIVWAKRALVATGLNRSNLSQLSPTLEILRQAVHENHGVRMTYRTLRQTEPGTRELDPYALVHRWGWWYVVGYCHLRGALRMFRVDRIQDLRLSERSFQPPEQFDVHAYLDAELQKQPLIRVRFRFAPQAAASIRENPDYGEGIEDQDDGSVVVSLLVPDLEWAASTALMYGPAVEVLDPPELRGMVCGWAQAVIQQYSTDASEGG